MGLDDERCSTLEIIIFNDDKDKFVSKISCHKYKSGMVPPVLLDLILKYQAVKCAAALLQGATGHTVDFYCTVESGLPVMHAVAQTTNYELIELFIHHGASLDHRCFGVGKYYSNLEGKLPLNAAVESISSMFSSSSIFFEGWNPSKPLFELLVALSMIIKKEVMDSIRVLVLNTKEAELEICHYAKEGNVVALAVILMTAREKVPPLMCHSTSNGGMSIHQCVLSKLEAIICEEYKPKCYNEQKKLLRAWKEKKAALTSVLVLLEIFEMEGDTIEAYIQQERDKMPEEQVALDVAWLLRGAKLLPKYRGINLNKIWSRPERRLGFMQPTRYAIQAKELVKWMLRNGEMNDNTKVAIEGPKESVIEEPKADISWNSPKILLDLHSKDRSSSRVSKDDPDKASNKEMKSMKSIIARNGFPPECPSSVFMSRSFHTIRADSGSQSTTIMDARAKRTIKPRKLYLPNILSCQQWASVAIAIKMGIRRF